jgi:hypothetical protein
MLFALLSLHYWFYSGADIGVHTGLAVWHYYVYGETLGIQTVPRSR